MTCPVIPKNESKADRGIRIVVGIIAFILGYFVLKGIASIVALVIAGLAIFTGVTGFCALYKLLGINTLKKK